MGQLNEKTSSNNVNDYSYDGDEEKGFDCDSDIETIPEESKNGDEIVLAKKETRAVRCFRSILVSVLVSVATMVSVSIFVHGRRNEINDFEKEYMNHGRMIVDSFQSYSKRRLNAINSFSSSITSYAISNGSRWPNVTFPDFERQAYYTLDLAAVLSITFIPIVSNDTRIGWEEYATNNQGWLSESLESQMLMQIDPQNDGVKQENLDALDIIIGDSDELQIPENIWKFAEENNEQLVTPETGAGPYGAWWQFAPAFPVSSIVNFNAISNPSRAREILTVLRTGEAATSRCFDPSDTNDPIAAARTAGLNLFLTRWKNGGNQYQDGPISDLYIPVFDQHNNRKQSVVALLTSYVYWQVYFTDVLPKGAHSVMAILENTCNQSFTYLINGTGAEYVGPGDLHDVKYDKLEMSTGFGAFLEKQTKDIETLEEQCIYNVRIYPTQTLEDQYMTNRPLLDSIFLLLTFAFTSFAFLMYDYLVERRQKMLMKTAIQSTEVVESLFPAVVRDRLYQENQVMAAHKEVYANPNFTNFAHFKLREENLMEQETAPNDAIADIYPNCTVFFADIKGFTSWSSTREPTQVFNLLETLYGALDKLAKKYKVFKIETIGDSYLAVTGLPDPQDDHAILMTKFASACLMKMNHVKHELSSTLGAETLKLDIRCGLHSGPVTAGVLRGQKARFQLFGDTVNTASRMESTGMPGRIQASSVTAEILASMGKTSWIRKREDLVEAKGKGKMQTYWLEPSKNPSTLTISSKQSECTSRAELSEYLSRAEF